MTIDPAVFRALVANGATPEMLLAVVEAAAAVDEARKEAKREGNAERQARFRERNNASNALQAVTERDSVTSPAPNKSPPYPQKLTPTPGEHTHAGARGTPKFPCPKGVETEHWSDFLANRQRKRLANTTTAYRAQLKALTDLSDDEWPPGRIVQFAAERGWGAIFDPRGREDRNGRHNGIDRMGGTGADRPSQGRTVSAALDFIADGIHH